MQEQDTFYPIKTVSRSVTKRRSRRISWFILGTGFGVSCAFALSAGLTASSSLTSPQTASISASEPEIATESEVPGINIVATAITSVTPAAPPAIAAAVEPVASATSAMYPLAMDLKVEDGDTLIKILADTGVTYEEAHNAVESIGTVYNPKKLDIGQNVTVVLDKGVNDAAPVITSIKLPISPTTMVEVTRAKHPKDNSIFAVRKIDADIERKLARAGGRIDSSLYETGMASGVPVGVLSEIITAYSYDVDFQRDLQPGDKMDVLFERLQTKEGVVAGNGNMLFAELDLSGKAMKIFRYVDKTGFADYYNEKGESIRKALLRTPINGAKITSAFGMRNHPLLGYTKMHRGIDFGAPTGTPIYAAGDGTVEFVGHKGGYGNYLRIRHNNKYDSAYAHISRFASGIAPGSKVKQGQIIAYVGATGMATGPHLHYEILVNNEQVNPAGVKFKTGNVLQGHELASFRKNMEKIQAQRTNTSPVKTDVAMAE